MYRAGEGPAGGLLNSTHGGGGCSDKPHDQQVTRHSPRMITECFLTRSMLIEMYVQYMHMTFTIDFMQELI